MLPWLRRIASCFFFTLAILSAALWVRSYICPDEIGWAPRRFAYDFRDNRAIGVLSHHGTITVQIAGNMFERHFSPGHVFRTEVYTYPIGLPTLAAALFAIAIRPKPGFKFSLADLLTLTTVAALIIGPLAYWLRSIS